ncbi:afadin isoform X6 [Sitodiplosis mosellana]|uniref:afadin isoform X6 n=1 Tax=Sitodiplosis mosellana TaxID=263140 RepID=UPI00244498A8|nr:afadin isoform X6 [Sitodiplosis mosellana]
MIILCLTPKFKSVVRDWRLRTMTSTEKRVAEREALRSVIQQWNANRLDLFELSEPDENLQFHGVMRFYFQDRGQKVATKCIRVASDATVTDVIETLIEKFRPDMRMLSVPSYALYEVHSNGEERKLNADEKPLLVQLNWHIDDREGRFLLRNTDQKGASIVDSTDLNFKRKLSKREKKEQKKKEKLAKMNSNPGSGSAENNHVAEKLYTELPETSFTRSISNPEAVMRRRRQQILEKKLQQFRSKDGGPDTGGTLKIYGESLCRDVPYKTLLLSIRDCAQAVVREMLSKYGLDKADPLHYCLVQVNSDGTEYILDDDECPLSILMNHPTSRGSIMFHVRRRPADSQPRRRKKKPLGVSNGGNHITPDREGPVLVEITHSGEGGRHVKLTAEPIEVGSANTNQLQLFGPSIQPRHCLISLLEGVCTVTPLHADALTFVNGHHIQQPTILHNGSVVMFGRVASYKFVDSPSDGRYNLVLSQSQLDSACLYERSKKAAMEMSGAGQEAILPAVLEFPETHQESFLHQIIVDLDVNMPNFKLAPVYTLYLCARYRASTHYRPDLQPTERAHKLTVFLHHVANLISGVVQERNQDPRVLSFWMANSSEFYNFLKWDRHISAFSVQAQEVLTESVQIAFNNLVNCFRIELSQTLNQFLSENIDHESAAGLVLTVLSSAMALLRRSRVNAALTIQLFSQLFHYINAICFNTVVTNQQMCIETWGKVIRERLDILESWAHKQGLELAAECHLAKINQCADFLQATKTSEEDVQKLACSCFRLNSLQMAALLSQEKIPRNLIDTAIRMAESVADELTRGDDREVLLEESLELPLALLIPEDGFSSDVVRGIPAGLVDFLSPLQAAGMCRLAAQPTSIGLWTVYMQQYNQTRSSSVMSTKLQQPEVQVIKLHKNANGMGLSIVAAKGAGQERLGIYIKSVVPGGAADADDRLEAGDQLLKVDGQSLIGITQERAADYLVRTGPVVILEVAKKGAIHHGLAMLLQQPSPIIQRAEEEYRPPNNSRLYDFDSDESLNIFEQDSAYTVPTFQPMPNFGRYNANDYLQNSPHMNYRRHSSYSHEDILNMKYQHVPVDPRYRDSRPFVKSNSNIYDNVRRDFMSRRRSSSSLQDDVLRPFQLLQMNEFLRKSSPTMHQQRTRSTSPNLSDKSNSNWNLNPSIFIEEYDDTKTEVKSNNSSTNISQTEIHQPLNEESVAPFAGCDEIPFIDDENLFISAHQICDDNIPEVNCVACNEPTVEMPKPSTITQYLKNRKTVSFDLELDDVDAEIIRTLPPPTFQQQQPAPLTQSQLQPPQSMFAPMMNKPNTCDHITNVMLNKCGKDAGTNSSCASYAATDPTTERLINKTNEPIFKFCTYKRSNSNTKPNNGTESFKNIPSVDNDNFSAYFYDEESNDGQILTNNKTINSASTMFDTKAIILDLSELNSNSTNSSTMTQYDSAFIADATEIVQQKQLISSIQRQQHQNQQEDQQQEEEQEQELYQKVKTHQPSSQTHSEKFAYIPVQQSTLPSFENKTLPGTGNVKALRNYFEQLKMPCNRLSKSSPNLSEDSNRKLSAGERQKVLDQLKIWSEFGTVDERTENRRVQNSNVITDPVTRSVLNLTVTATFDEHEHTSKIQLTESERSTSEPNIELCSGLATPKVSQHKKFPESYIVRKQKITTNIQTTDNCAQSCPNLQSMKSSAKGDNATFNSKLKASIYNSPCHRSTYLTLRKIKQNKKVNKLAKNSKSSGSGTSGSSHLNKMPDDSDGGDEAR